MKTIINYEEEIRIIEEKDKEISKKNIYSGELVRLDTQRKKIEIKIQILKDILEIIALKLKDSKHNKNVSEEGIELNDKNLEYHKHNKIKYETEICLVEDLEIKIEGKEKVYKNENKKFRI